MIISLSVILVVWNQRHLTESCLRSLAEQELRDVSLEVIVVDNGSTDGTVDHVRENHPCVRVLEMGENLGFAGANNRGEKVATGEWILLLNNDTELEKGALQALLTAMIENTSFLMAAPQMVRWGQPDIVDNRGIWLDWAGLFRQVHSGRGRENGPYTFEVFGPSGGAALIHRSVIEDVGLFDESLFAYLEDGDFACRARARGFRCLYVSRSVIRHHGSATAETFGDWKFSQIHRNLERLHRRWVRPMPFSLSWLAKRAYVATHYSRSLLQGRFLALYTARADGKALSRADDSSSSAPTSCDRTRLREWLGRQSRPINRHA